MSDLLDVFKDRQFQNIAVCHFNTTLSINLLVPILPVFLAGKGFAETQIGMIMGASALAALLVRPFVGMQVDTRGSRPILLWGQILALLSIIGFLRAEDMVSFVSLRFVFGIAMALYGTGAVTFASSIGTGKANSNAIALYTLMTMIGLGSSMSLAQVVFDHLGFSSTVLMASVLLVIAFCVMEFRERTIKPAGNKGNGMSFGDVLRQKAVLATSAGQFGSSFAFGAIFTFIPLAAIQSGISFYSFFFISFAITVIGSRFFVQRIIEQFGLEKTCVYAYMSMLLGVAPLVFAISPLVLVLTGLLFGAGFGVTFPAFVLLLVHRIDPGSRGTSLGLLIAAGDIAVALSVSILGGIAEHFGYFYLFLTVSVILTACMYILHALIPPKKPVRTAA